MIRRPIVFTLLVQAILLGIESFTTYDTAVRQVALVTTNIAATIGLVWLDTFFSRRGTKLSIGTFVLVVAAVWVDAIGNFQHLYGGFWWWDRVTHTAGGLAVSTLFMDVAMARRQIAKIVISPTLTLWFGFFLGQFVAAMYEVSEWLGDWWFQTERVRGPYDSPRDLFFNAFGGFIIFLIMRQMMKDKPVKAPDVLKNDQKML